MLVLITLAVCLVLVMAFFMNSLTDTILLDLLQPMAKIASQSVEGSLHTLVDRFLLIRDVDALANPDATLNDKQQVLDTVTSGIEFVWLGLYDPSGSLLTGSDDCPRSIVGNEFYSVVKETGNLVIEDTTVGSSGPEIVMGVPVFATRVADGSAESYIAYYLVGSYRYDVLSDVLGNIHVGVNGIAFIVNEEGEIIAHRDLGKVYSHEPIAKSLGSGETVDEFLDRMNKGLVGSDLVRASAGNMYVSYAPINGTRWSLGIQAPREDFTAATKRAVWVGALITVVALAFFILLLRFISRSILTAPLHILTAYAREIATGQFANELDTKIVARSDEIGELGAAFIATADSVRGVIHSIRKLTTAARAGDLGARAELGAYQGDYRVMIAAVNAAVDVTGSHLEGLPIALALFDDSRRVIHANHAMKNVLTRHGRRAQDPDLLMSLLSPGADQDAVNALFGADWQHVGPYSENRALENAQGEEFNYTLNVRRIIDEIEAAEDTEDIVCVMLIMNDVTQLTRARIDAEAASRSKSDFLSRMSHEMRTPMNAIIGMTTIGKAAPEIERKEYCLDKIGEASKHLLGVINDILDMSKIEANKFELSLSEFHFEKMLQRVVNVIGFRVDERRQNLFLDIDPGIPRYVISDEQRLAQVITNLLSNAVKFTPEEGSITLAVQKLSEEKDGGCAIRVSVKDTGIGISPEQQTRLFVSFEQADGSISRKFGGTGLGLAISKRIVELMDGRIWVESELDHGSNFVFTFNAMRGKDMGQNLLPPDINWKNLRVLAVDDAPEIRELLQAILRPYGIDCVTAANADEALRMMRERADNPFDLLFIDWRMPGLSGIELTRQIRREFGDRQIVVMISATEWAEIEQEARSAGVVRFLSKPLFASSLVDCINDCISASPKQEDEALGETEDGALAGFHVLLAEDVEINREIVQVLLEPTGIDMDFAVDGEEAVSKWSADPTQYDLILMDVHMPHVDGYEATKRIRASGLPRAADVPIIAMTANVFREDVERCLASGMNDHLGKPIDESEVVAKLRRYLLKN